MLEHARLKWTAKAESREMDGSYRQALKGQIDAVFGRHPAFYDHRPSHGWLTGALGDPSAGIWFVAENPSLGQVERVRDPLGGPPTEEAQWWASRADKLFRENLVRHGFKDPPMEQHGGWNCYITNVIKEADYAGRWKASPSERRKAAAHAWMPVLQWELTESKPDLVVSLGKTVSSILDSLEAMGLQFPRRTLVQHYSYVALRPKGKLGPMHPQRVKEYDEEFGAVARLLETLRAS